MFKSKPAESDSQGSIWARPISSGILVAFALAVGLVTATAVFDSVSQAMRSATSMVMPVGLLWMFMIAGSVVLIRSGQLGWAALFFACFVTLGVIGNQRFAAYCAGTIEQTYPEDNSSEFERVVVLGGGTTVAVTGTPELSGAGERVFSAAQLWHQGRTKQIVITGGDADDPLAPNVVSRELLASVGVPDEAIVSLTGDNTTEEMQSLSELFAAEGSLADAKTGLITSAFHLPRAMRLAKSNGLEFTPLPCAYLAGQSHPFSPRQLIPDVSALRIFSVVAKERLAKLLGR